jgi:hypothetical protein
MSTETGAVVASLAGAVVTSLASLDFDWLSQLVVASANNMASTEIRPKGFNRVFIVFISKQLFNSLLF